MHNKRGMTLVELMVVVGIIAFLALLIVSYLRSQVFKGVDARRKAEIKRIAIAVEEYEKDKDCYPLPSLVSCNPGTGLLPYLDKIPCDPTSGASYMYDHEDSICPRWFRIYGNLDNESDADYQVNIGPNSAFSFEYSSPNAPEIVQSSSTPPPGTSTPTPPIVDNFYGCRSGICVPITWDSDRPGPECDPNYQNPTCYGQCVNLENECEPWN